MGKKKELENEKELEKDEQVEESSAKSEIFETLRMVVIVAVVTILVRTFILVSAVVPTGSMLNTIHEKDRVIGNRLSYKFEEPERGDIVIFYAPDATDKTVYIKRLIGLPGDTVVIKEAHIYINGSETPLDEPYLKEEWVEYNDGYEFEVPADSYLFMGDNRNNSWDARMWTNTYVESDAIIAKAECIYLPFNHIGMVK